MTCLLVPLPWKVRRVTWPCPFSAGVALDVLFFGKKRLRAAMEIDDEQLLLDSGKGPRRRTECRDLAKYGAEQNSEDKARRYTNNFLSVP